MEIIELLHLLGSKPVRLPLIVIIDKNDRKALDEEPKTEAICDGKSGRLMDFETLGIALEALEAM